MKALLEGLRALGPARLAALGAVALGMLGMLALMVLHGGTQPMALLYGDLDLRDSAQVVDQLARRHIQYRIGGNGTQVLVSADQVAEARLTSPREGLPAGGSIGYEIFDRSDGIAATEFQQKINETRALEGEIARTIRAMRGIRACACTWCCRGASRSPATGRTHRPASCSPWLARGGWTIKASRQS